MEVTKMKTLILNLNEKETEYLRNSTSDLGLNDKDCISLQLKIVNSILDSDEKPELSILSITPMSKDEVPSNWSKNADGSYDVNGDVNLSRQDLLELPFRFGKVTGYFDCRNNQLTNLEGSPDSVGGDFYCSYNR